MAETTRDRLIDAAMQLFYNKGFHAVGLDSVLGDVGVTKTTFYKYFESKDDLILAVLAHRDRLETEEWVRTMEERAPGDPRGQILALFDILDDWFQHEDFRGCMFINAAVEFPFPNDPIHQAAAAHSVSLCRELARLAKEGGAPDPEALARRLVMLVAGSLITRHVAVDRGASKTARAMAELLLDGALPAGGRLAASGR